jgi:hypothetical protein
MYFEKLSKEMLLNICEYLEPEYFSKLKQIKFEDDHIISCINKYRILTISHFNIFCNNIKPYYLHTFHIHCNNHFIPMQPIQLYHLKNLFFYNDITCSINKFYWITFFRIFQIPNIKKIYWQTYEFPSSKILYIFKNKICNPLQIEYLSTSKHKMLTNDIIDIYKLCPKLKKIQIEDSINIDHYCYKLFTFDHSHTLNHLQKLSVTNLHPNLVNYIFDNNSTLLSLKNVKIEWLYDERLFDDEYDDLSIYIKKPNVNKIEINYDSWDTNKIECQLYTYTNYKITIMTSNIKLTKLYSKNGYRHLIY